MSLSYRFAAGLVGSPFESLVAYAGEILDVEETTFDAVYRRKRKVAYLHEDIFHSCAYSFCYYLLKIYLFALTQDSVISYVEQSNSLCESLEQLVDIDSRLKCLVCIYLEAYLLGVGVCHDALEYRLAVNSL